MKSVTGLALVTLAAAGLLYGYDRYANTEPAPQLPQATLETGTSGQMVAASSAPANPQDNLVKQLAIHFLEQYGETIDHPATQAKLFNERQKLMTRYPEQGQSLFEAAVALAFPGHKDAIFSLMERLARYQQWLEDSYLALQRMSVLERHAAIWQKREEMFGADAALIWAEEETAMYQKQEAVREELRRLDQAFEITPAEAAFQLQSAVDDIYGEGLGRQLITPDVLATSLFSLDAVQSHLQKLPEEERQPQINALRKQLGYPDEVIEKLEAQDRQRNERWQQGYQYMAEREQLALRYSGEQLNQELETLRQRYFGRSAKTIGLEEQEGFFRFNRPRRLGLN